MSGRVRIGPNHPQPQISFWRAFITPFPMVWLLMLLSMPKPSVGWVVVAITFALVAAQIFQGITDLRDRNRAWPVIDRARRQLVLAKGKVIPLGRVLNVVAREYHLEVNYHDGEEKQREGLPLCWSMDQYATRDDLAARRAHAERLKRLILRLRDRAPEALPRREVKRPEPAYRPAPSAYAESAIEELELASLRLVRARETTEGVAL